MIAIRSVTKNQGRTQDWQGRRGTSPAFHKNTFNLNLPHQDFISTLN